MHPGRRLRHARTALAMRARSPRAWVMWSWSSSQSATAASVYAGPRFQWRLQPFGIREAAHGSAGEASHISCSKLAAGRGGAVQAHAIE
jgi:hypothetical protein